MAIAINLILRGGKVLKVALLITLLFATKTIAQPSKSSVNETLFPIGMFSVNPSSAFHELKAAGFNTVHTYEFDYEYLKNYLKAAEKDDLKVLIYPADRIGMPKGKRNPREYDRELITHAIREFRGEKALLAWYLCDEPDQLGVPAESLEGLRSFVASLDANHPTAGAVWKPQFYKEFANGSDIFMVDPYPVPREPLTMVSDRIELARKTVGNSKPIWAILQAFGYQSERNNGWGWKREPTEAEMRAMTWLAVVHGVRGIFYYTYHGRKYFIKDSPLLWTSLKKIVRELNDLYPLLTSAVDDNEMFRINGKIHYAIRRVQQVSGKLEAGVYVLAVNTSDSAQDATYILSSSGNAWEKAIPLKESRLIIVRSGRIQDRMEPFAVKIYKLR